MDRTPRISNNHFAAPRDLSPYQDWLENNPEFARMRTIAPFLMRKLVMGLNLRAVPAAMRFFDLVDQVYHMSMGAPIEDLSQEIRVAAKFLSQAIVRALGDEKGAKLANDLTDCVVDNIPNLRRISAGAKGVVFTNFGTSVALVVDGMSKAVGISSGYQVKTFEGTRWPSIRILSKEESDLRALRENNPQFYEDLVGNAQDFAKYQAETNKKIIENGLVPATVISQGIPIPASENYITKEKTVFPPGKEPVSEAEFRRQNLMEARKNARLSSEFSSMYVWNSNGEAIPVRRPDDLKLAGLSKVSDEDLNNPEVIPLGPDGNVQAVEFRALTDDKAAQNKRGTRIYATRRDIYGQPVVVDGRFKGFYLDDLVNQQGRLVEGTAYDIDPNKSGIPVAFETLEEDGSLRLSMVNKEPYVTVNSQGKLLIKIPFVGGGRGTKDPFSLARAKMAGMASTPDRIVFEKDPSGKRKKKEIPGSVRGTIFAVPKATEEEATNTLFTFEPQDFARVRSAVGGMCMSSEAAKKIRDYFNQQARIEDSTRKENLKSYSLDRIGGFKVTYQVDPETGEQVPVYPIGDLLEKQKEALSWIEAKGYKGLAALDTGVGKTLLCISTMQKMTRDGVAGADTRFLYVCPAPLLGNFPLEVQKFMTDVAARDLLDRVDRMSYEEFELKVNGGKRAVKVKLPGSEKKIRQQDPVTGKSVWVPVLGTEREVYAKGADGKRIYEQFEADPELSKKYAAVFFDEAQALVKDENDKFSVAAQKFDHPRKVLLTASPMEDDPDQLYIGVAITNNQKISKKAAGIPAGSKELTPAQKELAAFRRRFCQRVGGRTIGIQDDAAKDPTKRQDFNAWVKNGMYFADKRTVSEPKFKLTDLKEENVSLTMEPEVETAYRKASQGIAKLLKLMVAVFRDNKQLGKAERDLVARYEAEFKKYRKQLDMLANYPDEVINPKTGQKMFPEAVSTKVTKSTEIATEKFKDGKRTLLFTDDDKLAVKTAIKMSQSMPDIGIAVALKSKVVVYQTGKVLNNPKGVVVQGPQIFTDKIPYKNVNGDPVPREEWASHVLRNVIGGDPTIAALILTKPYALGQNLQMFSTVIHLDRDNFSSEMMKQRQARAWRTGQKEPVEEYTLDVVYDDAKSKEDPTLDEVRKYIQEMQENLFNDIVHKSRETTIGEEWRGMYETQASLVAVNKKLFELAVAPYPGGVAEYAYNKAVTKS